MCHDCAQVLSGMAVMRFLIKTWGRVAVVHFALFVYQAHAPLLASRGSVWGRSARLSCKHTFRTFRHLETTMDSCSFVHTFVLYLFYIYYILSHASTIWGFCTKCLCLLLICSSHWERLHSLLGKYIGRDDVVWRVVSRKTKWQNHHDITHRFPLVFIKKGEEVERGKSLSTSINLARSYQASRG